MAHFETLGSVLGFLNCSPPKNVGYIIISISSFLKKTKAKKQLTLVKGYNFQIHRFIEEDALNLSEHFLVLIFFLNEKKKLNKKIKHISLSGVSYFSCLRHFCN